MGIRLKRTNVTMKIIYSLHHIQPLHILPGTLAAAVGGSRPEGIPAGHNLPAGGSQAAAGSPAVAGSQLDLEGNPLGDIHLDFDLRMKNCYKFWV